MFCSFWFQNPNLGMNNFSPCYITLISLVILFPQVLFPFIFIHCLFSILFLFCTPSCLLHTNIGLSWLSCLGSRYPKFFGQRGSGQVIEIVQEPKSDALWLGPINRPTKVIFLQMFQLQKRGQTDNKSIRKFFLCTSPNCDLQYQLWFQKHHQLLLVTGVPERRGAGSQKCRPRSNS